MAKPVTAQELLSSDKLGNVTSLQNSVLLYCTDCTDCIVENDGIDVCKHCAVVGVRLQHIVVRCHHTFVAQLIVQALFFVG